MFSYIRNGVSMSESPRWAVMWTLATGIYALCKLLTWSTTSAPRTAAWKHVAYLLAWPGMDAAAFLEAKPRTVGCSHHEWIRAASHLVLGAVLVFVAARLFPAEHRYIVGWIGMVGMVLMLHFGAFHLTSCVWRGLAVEARPLINRPLYSTSLGEFWSRRWNTAFRDLTHRYLFKPLTARFGSRAGILAGFAVSGLAHDLVISLPAGGGYGGPTLFFMIQGVAVAVEHSEFGRRVGLGRGAIGRSFAFASLITPLPLLFHRPFVVGIVVPFMHAIGALS
jgi:Membrane bound O-acyl transferase family